MKNGHREVAVSFRALEARQAQQPPFFSFFFASSFFAAGLVSSFLASAFAAGFASSFFGSAFLSWARAAVLATANRPAKTIDSSFFMSVTPWRVWVGSGTARGAILATGRLRASGRSPTNARARAPVDART